MSRQFNQRFSLLYKKCKDKTQSTSKAKPNKFVDPSYNNIMVHSDKLLIDTMHSLTYESNKSTDVNNNSNNY